MYGATARVSVGDIVISTELLAVIPVEGNQNVSKVFVINTGVIIFLNHGSKVCLRQTAMRAS